MVKVDGHGDDVDDDAGRQQHKYMVTPQNNHDFRCLS